MDKNNFSEIYKKYVMTAYSAAMQVVHNEADADGYRTGNDGETVPEY